MRVASIGHGGRGVVVRAIEGIGGRTADGEVGGGERQLIDLLDTVDVAAAAYAIDGGGLIIVAIADATRSCAASYDGSLVRVGTDAGSIVEAACER